jgi:alkylation response protein AidB-like acyl-CoA dehydrogenase
MRTSACFYHAGHGVQIAGTNYMLPLHLTLNDRLQGAPPGYLANSVIEQYLPGRTKLVFLDACRDNPLYALAGRGLTRGLAPVSVSEGTLIAYATKDGQVAQDGVGKQFPFTQALLDHHRESRRYCRGAEEGARSGHAGYRRQTATLGYGSLTGGELVLARIRSPQRNPAEGHPVQEMQVDIIEAARSLGRRSAPAPPEIEGGRRLPPDLARTLAAHGLFRSLRPGALHGLECDPATALASIEQVALADASVGWCVMIAATTGLSASRLAPEAAALIYPSAETITGGVFAPMGRAVDLGDRWRVRGRWKWGSGSAHCDWFGGGCLIEDAGQVRLHPDGAPDARMMYFRIDQATLHDTWHVSGLRGTGSGDVEVMDLEIPKSHSVSLSHDPPRHDGPLYRFPVFGLLALGIAAVMTGNALGAIDDLIEVAGSKQPSGSRRTLAERALVQAEVAQAQAALGAARALVRESVARCWRSALDGQALSTAKRRACAWRPLTRSGSSAEVARAMYDLAGGTAVFDDSPLQRRFRDAHVGTQHMMVSPATWELTGRVALGLPVDATLL